MKKLKKKEAQMFFIKDFQLNAITHEEALFYLEKVEKQLDDSVDTGKIITERATNMLGLSAGVLIALAAFCIGRWEEKHQWDNLLRMSAYGCLFFFVISIVLIYIILPTTYCISGLQPETIFKEELWNNNFNSDRRQKNIAINLLENYQKDIWENTAKNKKRGALYKVIIISLIIAPIAFAINYLFTCI
jgi:hypothetical protein